MTLLSPAARESSRGRFPSLPRTRSVALGVAVVALLAGALAVPGPAAADAAATPAGRYVPVGPVRVFDTGDTNTFGPGEARTVDLSKALPVPAIAVVLNLTAAGPSRDSYQTVYPTGTARPTASNLNEPRGQIRANSVTVAVGQGGANQNKVDLYNYDGSVRLVVDVTGYYTAANSSVAGTAYVPLKAPTRLFDSRLDPGPLTTSRPVGNATVDYGAPALNKVIEAVLVNITATEPSGPGYLTLWDGSTAAPNTSTLNFTSGQTVANLAIVPVRCADTACNELTFSVQSSITPSVQIIGDLQGAYVDPGQAGSLVFRPAPPTRLVDTRNSTPWPALQQQVTSTVAAGAAWAAGAQAVSLNVTAVTPSAPTFLKVWATGSDMPTTSNVNADPGTIVPNAVQPRVDANGTGFQVFNNLGRTDVVVDYNGAFVPDPAAASS